MELTPEASCIQLFAPLERRTPVYICMDVAAAEDQSQLHT